MFGFFKFIFLFALVSVQAHKRMGPELTSGTFLITPLPYPLNQILSLSLKVTSSAGLSEQLQDLPGSVSTALGLQRCRPGYHMGAGHPNSSPFACTASTLLTDLSLLPRAVVFFYVYLIVSSD